MTEQEIRAAALQAAATLLASRSELTNKLSREDLVMNAKEWAEKLTPYILSGDAVATQRK